MSIQTVCEPDAWYCTSTGSVRSDNRGDAPLKCVADATPARALTWGSSYERNKLLKLWRRSVCIMFAEQSRCIRLAWALASLFNVKTGYAYASNSVLAGETG